MNTPLAGLVGLPALAVALVLIFRGSRRLSFSLFNGLHSQYQAYRMAMRLQQVDRLERIFSTSPSSSERG